MAGVQLRRERRRKKRESRQGWKRHQKIREKMENQGPNCWGKISSKAKVPLSPDTQPPQLGAGLAGSSPGGTPSTTRQLSVAPSFRQAAWFSSAMLPCPSSVTRSDEVNPNPLASGGGGSHDLNLAHHRSPSLYPRVQGCAWDPRQTLERRPQTG